jgi:hypothetical protein
MFASFPKCSEDADEEGITCQIFLTVPFFFFSPYLDQLYSGVFICKLATEIEQQ